MATLQNHGGAVKTAVALKPRSTDSGAQVRTTYALCGDGAVLVKIDAQERGYKSGDGLTWRTIRPYKIAAKAPTGAAFFARVLASPAFSPSVPSAPTANARFVMARKGFDPTPSAETPPLEKVQTSYAKHAPLDSGFKGDRAPPVPEGPWRSDFVDSAGRLQSMTGGEQGGGLGNATFPKGLSPGMFYPAMTYLTGRQAPGNGARWGAPATHAQIHPIALKLFEDADGIRACWLYDAGNGRWDAAFMARCPEMDPVMHAQDPGARLKALLIRATGCNPENAEGGEMDGLQFGAQVSNLDAPNRA